MCSEESGGDDFEMLSTQIAELFPHIHIRNYMLVVIALIPHHSSCPPTRCSLSLIFLLNRNPALTDKSPLSSRKPSIHPPPLSLIEPSTNPDSPQPLRPARIPLLLPCPLLYSLHATGLIPTAPSFLAPLLLTIDSSPPSSPFTGSMTSTPFSG